MKKLLVVLIALLFATGAFAQEAKKAAEFKYGFSGISYGVSGTFKDGSDKSSYDYSHIRVRPTFQAGNENVKAVVTLEIDQDFGANPTFNGKASQGADAGTDNQVVEVKHAYFEVSNILIPNLTFTTGLQAYYFPLLVDNDFGMMQASYDFGMGKVNLSYIKLIEGEAIEKDATQSPSNVNTDVQTYAIDAVVKVDAISIKPGFLYTQFGKSNLSLEDGDATTPLTKAYSFYDGKMYAYGLNVAGDFGMIGFDATYVMTGGKANRSDEDTTNGSGLDIKTLDQKFATSAFDVIATIKVEPAKIGVFYTQYSGDDSSTDNKTKNHVSAMDHEFGAPDGRLFILDAAGTAANGGWQPFDDGAENLGLKIYGINCEASFGKLTVLAQYGYVTTAKKYANAAGSKKNSLGQEIDLKASFEVAPSTALFIEYGYVAETKDFNYYKNTTDKKRTIQEVIWGLSTKI